MARTERLSISIDPRILDELRLIAEETGVSVNALCAVIIGQHVQNALALRKTLSAAVDNALSQALAGVDAELSRERAQQLLNDAPCDEVCGSLIEAVGCSKEVPIDGGDDA